MIENYNDVTELEIDNISEPPEEPGETEEEPTDEPTEEPEEEEETLEDVDTPVEDPKYELTGETKEYDGVTVHRIRALKDFGNVHTGQLGGWVEEMDWNLSHDGNCWVYDDGVAAGKSYVWGNAQIRDEAYVSGCADVGEDAKILNQARVFGNCLITEKAVIRDFAVVCGDSVIGDHATVENSAFVRDAGVRGYAKVKDRACAIGCTLAGHAYMTQDAIIDTAVHISGFSVIGEQNRLTWYEDPNTIAQLRCSLLSLETTHPQAPTDIPREEWEEDDGAFLIKKDLNDANLYRVTVYPDQVLELKVQTVDPLAKYQIITDGSDWDITDDPRIYWPKEFIGMTDKLYIKVTHPYFEDITRTYTLHVNIEAVPGEEVPDEPPEEIKVPIDNIIALAMTETIDDIFAVPTDDPMVFEVTLPTLVGWLFAPDTNEVVNWHLLYHGNLLDQSVDDSSFGWVKPSRDEIMLEVFYPDDSETRQIYTLKVKAIDYDKYFGKEDTE